MMRRDFLEFCMTASYDKLVVDNEIIGMVMRAVDGIKVNDETLAFDLIKKAGPGGHFISARHTRRHMRSELYKPRAQRQGKSRSLAKRWGQGQPAAGRRKGAGNSGKAPSISHSRRCSRTYQTGDSREFDRLLWSSRNYKEEFMIIIGEKINASIPAVKTIIQNQGR